MSNELAKSPEVLLKEAKIKELQVTLKKRQTTLKSLKTRLKNMQTDISEISRRTQTEVFDKMLKVDALRKEIAELAKQLEKVKGMSQEDKEQLQIMAKELMQEGIFGEGEEAFEAYREQRENPKFDFDENYRAKMRDMFQEFRIQPEEKEQKDIRKTFIKLSNKFHPDRARNDKEEKEFHTMMLQINEAYQAGDIQILLELDRLYLTENLDLSEVKELTVDILQKEIDRLEKEIQMIDNQVDRTSEEISNLRNSDLGSMLSGMKKAEREGEGMDEMTAEMDSMIYFFETLKAGMTDSIEQGELSPILEELMMEQSSSMLEDMDGLEMFGDGEMDEETLQNVLEMLTGEGFSGATGFGKPLKNPKFKIGSSVRVKKAVKSEVMPGLKMKNWEGRVVNAYIGIGGKEIYEVEFDSITQNQIPEKYLKDAVEEMEDFTEHEFMASELEKSQPRDKKNDPMIAYRTLFHQYSWDHLDNPKQHKRLQDIMLAMPEKSDIENWEIFLEENLKFPFEAVGMGSIFNGLPDGKVLTVERLLGQNEDFGIMVGCNLDGQKISYPLIDLTTPKKRGTLYHILDDYTEWGHICLDI